ncbi:hypothetical protein [uncultured Roseobacter sp.]|uniref:hypothetical protein n=1 Tax=uncultured Roseobacter sp. TaxID=114847 RepID=UPI00261143B9|nr:hypothetical protein [uncultured Roseobacter sp.]
MPEAELLAGPGIVILLAEPGAGKTALLDSIADQLGADRVRASAFRQVSGRSTLVVDAFDEVARIGDARVHDILHQIRDAEPDRVLLSSRSGEWEDAKTRLVGDLFGVEPHVTHLVSLESNEQRQLFEYFHADRSFDAFAEDISRFDLHHLLGNPEFLRLFAGAYVEADGHLPSRSNVFTLAIEHLAREANPNVPAAGAPARHRRTAWANEIFAKILLSGADGVAVGDIAEDDLHPQFETIGLDGDGPASTLSTKLFRPGAAANQHEPVHRIVAEYGAAQHLVGLIDDPASRFNLERAMALIAPNGVVRDDLRGLLGWMAALGSQSIQDTAIELDAYAVLSNGDPSRLTSASRISLLDALSDLNADDPYFRRSDQWRTFRASGLFTPDMLEALRPLLVESQQGHLQGLLLELLVGAPIVSDLRNELETILYDAETSIGPRLDALSCLLNDSDYDPIAALQRLIGDGAVNALRLATEVLMFLGTRATYDETLATLRAATALYSTDGGRRSRNFDDRYFLTRLVGELDEGVFVRLLDDLTVSLQCTCCNERHACHCRDGMSKTVGMLLDRYFELATGPHDPDQIWGWVRNLHFHSQTNARQSRAVEVLQGDDILRRALQEHAFAGLIDNDEIFNVLFDVIGEYGHSGLNLREGDDRNLVDLAFQNNNPALWGRFIGVHRYHGEASTRGPDEFRRYCREQALEKPALMREWAWLNRARRDGWRKQRPRRYRFEARRRRSERRIEAANTTFFHENRTSIERGENVRWTHSLARAYLIDPEKLPEVTHGLFDPDSTLRQSLTTLSDRCPTIAEVGEGDARAWVQIFLAGALAEYRATGTLDEVAPEVALAILHDTGGYKTYADGEQEAFHAEVQRLAQLSPDESEAYARAYLEPAMEEPGDFCDLHILQREPMLNHLRATLPLEWLQRFPELAIHTLETLFDMAASFGNREALLSLIRVRCVALGEGMLPHRHEEQRPFWFMRDFWFAEEINPEVWDYMIRDPNLVFWLERRRDRGRQGDDIWSTLSAEKIEQLQLAYRPHWPVVPLPSSWGTGSPRGETAYRYLRDSVWQIGREEPNAALPVIERLLAEDIMAPSYNDLRSIRAELRRRSALASVRPGPADVARFIDAGLPASVEQTRALVKELFQELQREILAGHTGLRDQFYDGGGRLNEVRGMARIAAWLRPRLAPLDIHDVIEHQLAERNRCDLTATRMVNGAPRMLVIEGKGQWHRDLFGAAATQLADRYTMHPDADEQGVYLVLWYGSDEVVAGSGQYEFQSAADLWVAIEARLPDDLRGRIDVHILDLSQPDTARDG